MLTSNNLAPSVSAHFLISRVCIYTFEVLFNLLLEWRGRWWYTSRVLLSWSVVNVGTAGLKALGI